MLERTTIIVLLTLLILAGGVQSPAAAAPDAPDTVDGDPWTTSGTIIDLDETGITLLLGEGSNVYIVLGPADYWQAQDLSLALGDAVTVDTLFDGARVHAVTLTTEDGETLRLRTPDGAALWTGAVPDEAGWEAEEEDEALPEDWLVLTGAVTALKGSRLSVDTDEEGELEFRLGPRTFWEAQDILFAPGDEISVLGFWEDDQFLPVRITKLETDETLALRDGDGYPLWKSAQQQG
ncbi:MAG: hypothetical protein JXB47_19615 [Anaerolineae bacterium]|nr:hypothetical protein [Anaerolineae bacterium]